MDKTITTAFMVIISVIVSVMVYNAVYPAAVEGSNSIRSMRQRIDERIQSQLAIVHTAGELDRNGTYQDTNGDGHFNVFIWTKNVGSARISAVPQMDIFFGPDGNFTRIPNGGAGSSYPYWDWTVENDTAWNPTSTLRITIHTAAPLASGRYFIKIVLPTGTSEETYLGL
jgi:archaellum component FlaG (FlaF/FlaG flagellin family)